MKAMGEQVSKGEETMANIRGKVELTKDNTDNLSQTVEKLGLKFDEKISKLSILESNITGLKASLKAQQSASIDGETVATQLSAEKDRLEAELQKAREIEAELMKNREKLDEKLEILEENMRSHDESLAHLKTQSYSENKIRNLIGEEMKDFHDIVDDACGRLATLEGEKDKVDSSILKEAEKANKNAELLLEREEVAYFLNKKNFISNRDILILLVLFRPQRPILNLK